MNHCEIIKIKREYREFNKMSFFLLTKDRFIIVLPHTDTIRNFE